ncbi:type II secretion system GspH family protein [Candidatus Parcubacteria bacterium]|nr:type II secretion system GspH family protein [Candidatus Parcubacteria bacterium]
MKRTHTNGFTLIELLVVIAIIGILSSVVLASLNVARTRGADSSVKAALKQMQTQVQNYLDSNSNLGVSVATCASGVFADTRFSEIRANVLANAAPGATMSCATDSTASKWAVGVSALKGGGTWCVDNSQGWFKAGTVDTVNGVCQ